MLTAIQTLAVKPDQSNSHGIYNTVSQVGKGFKKNFVYMQ